MLSPWNRVFHCRSSRHPAASPNTCSQRNHWAHFGLVLLQHFNYVSFFCVFSNRTRSSWTLWHSAKPVSVPLWRSVWKVSSAAPPSWPTLLARVMTAASASWLSAMQCDRPFKTCWASTWTTWVPVLFIYPLMPVFLLGLVCKDSLIYLYAHEIQKSVQWKTCLLVIITLFCSRVKQCLVTHRGIKWIKSYYRIKNTTKLLCDNANFKLLFCLTASKIVLKQVSNTFCTIFFLQKQPIHSLLWLHWELWGCQVLGLI